MQNETKNKLKGYTKQLSTSQYSEQLKNKSFRTKQLFLNINNTLHNDIESIKLFLIKKGFTQIKQLRNELLVTYKQKGYVFVITDFNWEE